MLGIKWMVALLVGGLWAEAARGQSAVIIVDDADKESVTLTGAAVLSKPNATAKELKNIGLVGDTVVSIGAWSQPNLQEASVTFAPQLPKAGWYEVYVRWWPSAWYGTSDATPITVSTADGKKVFVVNQRLGNAWVFFGTYRFEAGRKGTVSAQGMGTFGVANIDAVKLVPVDKPTRPAKPKKLLPVAKEGMRDDFDKLRVKIADLRTAPLEADEADADVEAKLREADLAAYLYWETMDKRPESKTLWSDLNLPKDKRGGDAVMTIPQRLNLMARAYVYSSHRGGFGQKMMGNEQLKTDILNALEWLNREEYNEKTVNPAGGAWFPNEIVIPKELCETVILMYPHLTPEQIDRYMAAVENMTSDPRKHYIKGFPSTGANRVWLCYVHVLRGVIEKDAQRIELSRDALGETLVMVNNGDGFYVDGSFIQHGHIPYNGAYGIDMIRQFADIVQVLKGTRWEVRDPRWAKMTAWVYDGLEPLMYRGDEFYRTIGRAVGMKRAQNNVAGYGIMETVATLIGGADDKDKATFQNMLKAWLLEDAYKGVSTFDNRRISIQTLTTMKRVLADETIRPWEPPSRSKVFYNMDMVVHHRPAFAAALSMSSTRIATHESITGDNKRGWYQGEGALMVYTPDPSRYNEDFWPTVNPYRLPGITVDTRVREDGKDEAGNQGALSKSPWAGGTEAGGAAAASMELMARDATLSARKSYFFLGGQIVCLGANIHSTDGRTTETVVENAKLNAKGDNALTVDGKGWEVALGWKGTLAGAKWIHLAGSVAGGDIGWYFPQGTDVQAVREARTGAWSEITKGNDPTPVTRNYLTLWLDHGKNPTGGTYAYVILPGKSERDTEEYAGKPQVKVLENTAAMQVVQSTGLLAGTFWTDEGGSAGRLRVSGKGNALVAEGEKEIEVAVADPTHLNTKEVVVTLEATGSRVITADEGVTVEKLNPLTVRVELRGSGGKTRRAKVAK